MASALIENETLIAIDLGHNAITNKGGLDLLKVLSCNETIEEMKLDGNKIDQKILDEIDQELSFESSSEEEDEEVSADDSASQYSSEEEVLEDEYDNGSAEENHSDGR